MNPKLFKLNGLLFGVLFLLTFCTIEEEEDIIPCSFLNKVSERILLSPQTSWHYYALSADTISYKNNQGEIKHFRIYRSDGAFYPQSTIFNEDDGCNYLYNIRSNKHTFNYSNIDEHENILLNFYIGGYVLKNNNIDSLMILYDYLSFGGGNVSIVSRFVSKKREDIILDDERYLYDYLVEDTTINQINYDSVFILPNRVEENNIIYSSRFGIIQFENKGVIWDISF